MLGFLFRWLDCEPPLREGQILAYAGVSVLGVKRFSGGQGQGVGRRPGVPRRAMAFSCIASFRITVVSATLPDLPRARKPR